MRYSLDKNWKLTWLLPSEYIWRELWKQKDLDRLSPPLDARWIPATVPGCVQADALEAGVIPDPNYALNSLQCEWTSDRDWVYINDFDFQHELHDKKVILHFEGVDYSCHVYLNGEHLGDHQGMFVPFEFDVTDKLKSDAPNRLMVVVDHAPDEQGQIGWTSKVRIWKARFAYNWDWCTRLIPLGIWDHVSLVVTGKAYIKDIQIYTQIEKDAKVRAHIDIHSHKNQEVFADCTILRDNTIIAESTIAGRNRIEANWDIKNPDLWFPNGHGQQPLYTLHVTLRDKEKVLDKQSKCFGLRDLQWIPNDGAPPDALAYTVQVNGKRIFLKGWNWVPMDHFYGKEMSDRYEHFLRLAKAANVNLLRVWGGGLLEKEIFYDLCDQYGIMVWQEFIQSSSGIDNNPSSDQEYLTYIENQARRMVPRRRHHPSLAVWSGGNELMNDDYEPLGLEHPAIAKLASVVNELDPGRYFLPTSPSGPVFEANLKYIGMMHDVHGPWKYSGIREHYQLNNNMDALLYSEFGVDGAANMDTLLKIAREEDLFPPDDKNPIWIHHGSWWIQWDQIHSLFGEIGDLKTYIKASQWLQCEGLRYAIEANRRRKWRCSGTFPWQYNEGFPNTSCTNCVDYYGNTKPAYWYVKRAYSPLLVSARYETIAVYGQKELEWQLHLNNSYSDEWRGDVEWKLQSLDGHDLSTGCESVKTPANSHIQIRDHSYSLAHAPNYLILMVQARDTEGRECCKNHYIFSNNPEPVMSGLLTLPETSVDVVKENGLHLINNGNHYALGVIIKGTGEFLSDNYLIMAPGEKRIIDGASAGNPHVIGWNLLKHTA